MPEPTSHNGKGSFFSKYLWPFALLAAVLALSSLILGSRLPRTVPLTPEVAPSRHATLVFTPEATPAPARTSTPHPTGTATSAPVSGGVTYYVDSSVGSDANSCTAAQNPATPKKTVNGVMSCNPGPGETVRLRGEYTQDIYPNRSGTVLYDVQNIAQVNGSVVTFNQSIAGVYASTDYVTIYGSRKGNSGAFAVVSVSGNSVTVDASNLPGGQFRPEAASDPGELQAAILRPVRFTAWDASNPPVYTGQYQAYHAINQRVIMVDHIKSIAGNAINPGYWTWPAFKIDGNNNGNSDFQIFDHLEVTNAECAIAVEFAEFQSNYDIIQYNYVHDDGYVGDVSDEFIYFGNAMHPERHHDYVQIMYNKVGPHIAASDIGDGIEIKHSAHNATVFGNEIFGIHSNGCADAPIKVSGTHAFIANNYLHDIASPDVSCGISIVNDQTPYDPTQGGYGTLVVNNIIAGVRSVGIHVLDTSQVQILNNTIYNIPPEPNSDAAHLEENMGIEIQNWQGPTENIVIQNNIVQAAHIGIGRYIWSHDYPVSIDSDYNIVFNADYPFHGSITQNAHDLVANPALADPANHNFALTAASPARDSGTDLTTVLRIDNHDAAAPTLPGITAPIARSGAWDRGAYEY